MSIADIAVYSTLLMPKRIKGPVRQGKNKGEGGGESERKEGGKVGGLGRRHHITSD